MKRSDVVADAAITLLAERGMRGLTHRAVDEFAGLPPGSTSNLARTRAALLELTLQRLSDLEAASLAPAMGRSDERSVTAVEGSPAERAVASSPHASSGEAPAAAPDLPGVEGEPSTGPERSESRGAGSPAERGLATPGNDASRGSDSEARGPAVPESGSGVLGSGPVGEGTGVRGVPSPGSPGAETEAETGVETGVEAEAETEAEAGVKGRAAVGAQAFPADLLELGDLAGLMAELLWAQIADRRRTLARYELALEATRRPELREIYDMAGARFRDPAVALLAAAGSRDPVRHGRQLVAYGEGIMFDAIAGAGVMPSVEDLRAGLSEFLSGMLS